MRQRLQDEARLATSVVAEVRVVGDGSCGDEVTSGGDPLHYRRSRASFDVVATRGKAVTFTRRARTNIGEEEARDISVSPSVDESDERSSVVGGILGPGPSVGDAEVGEARVDSSGGLQDTPRLAVEICEGLPGDDSVVVAHQDRAVHIRVHLIVETVSLKRKVEDYVVVISISKHLILKTEDGHVVLWQVRPRGVNATRRTALSNIIGSILHSRSEVRVEALVRVGVGIQEENHHVVCHEGTEVERISRNQTFMSAVRRVNLGHRVVRSARGRVRVLGVSDSVDVSGSGGQESDLHRVIRVLREVDVDVRANKERIRVSTLREKRVNVGLQSARQGSHDAGIVEHRIARRAICRVKMS